MSPLTLRRYRADRLLREEFDRLKRTVIDTVRARLRASGVRLDSSDLEACYAQAWHGLYAAVVDGQEVANLTGWLALVTFRRAIDEARARGREGRVSALVEVTDGSAECGDLDAAAVARAAQERDLAAELDDRAKLRQLFEGLRGRLSEREREAAALCYLQGLSRVEAAAHMGVSTARMQKLMEGGAGRQGVAGKMGALVETIRRGEWCDEQGSLMRGFAYGILDPQGERYRQAMLHRSECSACRAYVLSLRGLAAALPVGPSLLHWALDAGASLGAGAGAASRGASAAGARAGLHGGAGAGASAGAGAQAGAGVLSPAASGVGALSTSGAAGASAGGGWLLAGGSVGAKLAVGCLLAIGIGAGCVAIDSHAPHPHRPGKPRGSARAAPSRRSREGDDLPPATAPIDGGGPTQLADASPRGTRSVGTLTPAAKASREFGFEEAPDGSTEAREPASVVRHATAGARSASAGSGSGGQREGAAQAVSSKHASSATGEQSPSALAAAREFGPG